MIDTKKLSDELKKLPIGGIVFVETESSKLLDVHLAAVKWINDRNYTPIVISASVPCKKLVELYDANGVDISRAVILCAYPLEKKEDKLSEVNFIHISGKPSFVEIAITLSEQLKRIEDKKFIFFDTINQMMARTESNTLAKFIHSVLTKMRANKVSGLLVSVETGIDKETRAEIAQLCDKVIKV